MLGTELVLILVKIFAQILPDAPTLTCELSSGYHELHRAAGGRPRDRVGQAALPALHPGRAAQGAAGGALLGVRLSARPLRPADHVVAAAAHGHPPGVQFNRHVGNSFETYLNCSALVLNLIPNFTYFAFYIKCLLNWTPALPAHLPRRGGAAVRHRLDGRDRLRRARRLLAAAARGAEARDLVRLAPRQTAAPEVAPVAEGGSLAVLASHAGLHSFLQL